MMEQNLILNKEDIQRKITRIAFQLLEENTEEHELFILGVKEAGLIVARRICDAMQQIPGCPAIKSGWISINKVNPLSEAVQYSIPVEEMSGKTIIMVDDVGNTGRTLFYAIQPLMQVLPAKIQVAVLVDRRHKLFPIQADIVGLSLATTIHEHITVRMDAEQEGVYLS
jgi:pyrimidine operon attenuation protein/uracil phosphoribosyltransferase